MKTLLRISILGLLPSFAAAQNAGGKPTFQQVAADVQRQLDESVAELSKLRAQIAAEKIPLSKTLHGLEAELQQVRQEYQHKTRLLDGRTLDLANLRAAAKAREEENAYLSTLLGEYQRNFESNLHIAELQRYRAPLETARLAAENRTLALADVYAAQAAVLAASLDRLHDAAGGCRYDGTAVDANGAVKNGAYVLMGPTALFRTADGQITGTAEQRLGSLEPGLVAFTDPKDVAAGSQLVSSGAGLLPFDPSLGNAHKMAAVQDTLWEHIRKGGVVMFPIFVLAGAALLVALYKWLRLLFVARPSRRAVAAVLDAVAHGDDERAAQAARALRGPTGAMLTAGTEHLGEPRALIEEVMYEKVLATRLGLNRWLPFIAITASSAPLLGLLGTVTGIMNTFTLMTVFGTGDVKTLSSGISEALITTEFGLYVAIPALLLYAFLSRKARSIVDGMEQAAVALLNEVSRSEARAASGENGREPRSEPRDGADRRTKPTRVESLA